MNLAHISYTLTDHTSHALVVEVSEDEASILQLRPGSSDAALLGRRKLEDLECDMGSPVASWRVELVSDKSLEVVDPDDSNASCVLSERSAVHRARSLLAFAYRLLPADTRLEVFDEWMDEIETAAEEKLRVRRRTISIILRSLPIMVFRSRRPVRVREGRG